MYNSLTVTVDGSDYILNKINQDAFTGEFMFRNNLMELRARIRHTTYADKQRGGTKVERHTVELVQRTFATVAATQDTVRKSYIVIENDYRDDLADAGAVAQGLIDFVDASGRVTELLNWAS